MKFCVDCKSHEEPIFLPWYMRSPTEGVDCCLSEEMLDPVTGSRRKKTTCEQARRNEELCGRAARYFEAKEKQLQ